MALNTLPPGSARPARPPYRQWRYLALVAAGGTIGTAMREIVTILLPEIDVFPVATFGINLVGAFSLGLLLEVLARSGPDVGRRRGLRLLVGTGVLGGFTTYSALATATSLLLTDGLWWWAFGYAVGSVLLGAVMSGAGIALGSVLRHRKENET